ncbi:MAG: YccF domain-containing protein [Lachnospiraceae bacterium]|nr:YccF domain-containing protein [Lachnospiraceae bacterium]
MKFLGNVIWLVFGGFEAAVMWALFGVLWCVTIVGIPVGVQCFKAASLVIWPFGKEVVSKGGVGSFIVNVIWFFIGGLVMALTHLLVGAVYCITVIGIPFGLQHFKFAKLAIMPFGAEIR